MRRSVVRDDVRWLSSIFITQPIRKSPFWQGKLANIQLGASMLDGIVVPPGGVFSFWTVIGRPSQTAGYAIGRAIRDDLVGGDIGGGLCQLSGIAYEAGLRAGLDMLERHPHSRDLYNDAERFTPLGLDATVVWPWKDLRLGNPYDFAVMLRLGVNGFTLTAEVLGVEKIEQLHLEVTRNDSAIERHVVVTRSAPGRSLLPVSEDRYVINASPR